MQDTTALFAPYNSDRYGEAVHFGCVVSRLGLPERVTESEEAYAALALELATNPERPSSIRGKLGANRMSAPLFDSELFTRHLEAAYLQAYQRYFAGEAPGTIIVGRVAQTPT